MANISVSTVGGILKDLKSDNYILQISEGEKKLHNKGELLSHWVTAFNQKLKPKLFRGRYRFGQPYSQGSWKSLDLGNYAFWGGSQQLITIQIIYFRRYGPFTPTWIKGPL